MFAIAFLAVILFPQLAHAQDAQSERREPTLQERESFNAFYRSDPSRPQAAPAYEVTREPGRREWRVEAVVSTPASRGVGMLCRMNTTRYVYAPQAPQDRRWSNAGTRHFAWLDRASCGKPSRPVELLQRIPDMEVIPLIEQHGVLLLRARLLLGGNTSCAAHRALRYRLQAIDVSAPPHGKEELYALVFDSDRVITARVWVKKRGAELNAWDVACGVPHTL